MNLTRLKIPFIFLLLVAASFLCAASPGGGHAGNETRTARALKVKAPPKIDGSLEEEAWREASVLSDFRQKDPRQGEPATEKTQVKIVYTENSIFFGVICYDSELDKIRSTERRRDNPMENDDTISLIIDTFHDHRNSFIFRTNPSGNQFDALITDEGRFVNSDWNEKWEVAARTNEAGWTAEFEIPFKTLRVPDRKEQVWGIDFQRTIRRKNEFVFWNSYRRDFLFEQVSQAGHLTGLVDIETGLKVRIKPFLKAGLKERSIQSSPDYDGLWDGGLEDIKYRITPGFTADFTVNTDFAQTEVDEQVVNITRFPIFFPEKREFFLEGIGIFDFGTVLGPGFRKEFTLFHSRRVGLSDAGAEIPIIAGAKATGKLAGLELGLLNVQSKDPGGNLGALRLKKEIFSRSSVGALLTNRHLENYNNSVLGVDANLVFLKNLNLMGFLSKSQTTGLNEGEWYGGVLLDYQDDFWWIEADHLDVQPNFRSDLGFLSRNAKKDHVHVGIKPRPRSKLVRQFMFRHRVEQFSSHENVVQSRKFHYPVVTIFQSGDRLEVDFHSSFERLSKPFRIRPDLVIPVGDYRSKDVRIQYDMSPSRRITGGMGMVREWDFFGGDRLELNILPLLKFTDKLSVNLGYTLNDVSLPVGDFASHVVNGKINYAFSNTLLTSTTVQYNSIDRIFILNFRLNRIWRLNDNFFLVYNETRDAKNDHVNRAVIAKLTYSFDF